MSKTKATVPSIVKGCIENKFGRFWIEIQITENGINRWEFFNDVYARGAELKAIARINFLLGES